MVTSLSMGRPCIVSLPDRLAVIARALGAFLQEAAIYPAPWSKADMLRAGIATGKDTTVDEGLARP